MHRRGSGKRYGDECAQGQQQEADAMSRHGEVRRLGDAGKSSSAASPATGPAGLTGSVHSAFCITSIVSLTSRASESGSGSVSTVMPMARR